MAIEEKEQQETLLKDLIEKVEKDPLPTNIFDIETTDPLVLLGKMNEIISKLKGIQSLISSSDTKANQAVETAINALNTASQALKSANTAIGTANTAIETSNTAIGTANEAKEQSTRAEEIAGMANDTAGEALAEATDALRVANEALSQVVAGYGTKIYDVSGNLLNNAKFTGHNGINVDMSETDNETFDIRLDETITTDIENAKSNIEQLSKGQADNDIAIVALQSKTLTHDTAIANAQSTADSAVTKNTEQDVEISKKLPVEYMGFENTTKIKFNPGQDEGFAVRIYDTNDNVIGVISLVTDGIRLTSNSKIRLQSNFSQTNSHVLLMENGLFLDDINLSMTPSDSIIQDFDARPVAGENLFTAPTNGVFYARYTTNAGGTLGLHLRTSDDINLSFNTQILTGTTIYNAVFVMKQGQKIYCYENTLNIIWGDYSFVKSEGN